MTFIDHIIVKENKYKKEFATFDYSGTGINGLSKLNGIIYMLDGHKGAGIGEIEIYPSYRGKGTGLQVITNLENYLRNRGIEKLELNATPEAYEFWRKIGYTGRKSRYGYSHMYKKLLPEEDAYTSTSPELPTNIKIKSRKAVTGSRRKKSTLSSPTGLGGIR
jgi:GNAT superfamily N-acetyltransferase